jgi:hypothetical protein
MRELGPQLWVAESPQRFGGIEIGTRMSIVRLADGGLFLHSPVPLGRVRAALERLGRPRYAVAPNRLHHLYAAEYTAAFPELALYLASRRSGPTCRTPAFSATRRPRPGAARSTRRWSGAIRC